MSSVDAILEQVNSLDENDKEGSGIKIYSLLFDYYTSPNCVDDYQKAVKLLDTTSLSKNDEWILFKGFSTITTPGLYTDERLNKLCDFWLPKYESMIKELISSETNKTEPENINRLPLNAIKYLITNMLNMQLSLENIYDIFKSQTQFLNFKQKDQYLSIIKLVMPLLINQNFLEDVDKDDHTNIKLELKPNELSNTRNITSTFTMWIILKLLIMFIKTDGDCLTIIKQNSNIKETLIKSLKQIKNNRSIKLSLYASLALLMNEEDIKNEIEDPKYIIKILIDNINQVIDSMKKEEVEVEEEEAVFVFSNNGVHVIDLMVGLKACLQHDQVKNGFLETNGIELLTDLSEGILDPTQMNFDDDDDENKSESKLEKEEPKTDPEVLKEITKLEENAKTDMIDLFREMGILALECLFAMSFNKEAVALIKKNEEFMSALRKFADEMNITSTKNERVKKAVDGVLWKLEKEDEFINQQKESTKPITKDEFDMMISYSWSDKPLIQDLYKYLTEQFNYRIWLDENQMAGSLCQAMAQAVEKSKFVLMCMSETYKTSENCRNEAEYARDRKKTIIPLIVKAVERDGWLGFISAGKMYIDFAKQDFQKAIQLLKAEIDRHQKEKGEQIQPVKPKENSDTFTTIPTLQTTKSAPVSVVGKLPVRPSVISDAYKNTPIELWSDENVQHFLYDNKLDIMIILTENMNGEELHLLLEKCQMDQDYWIMFERLNKELEKRYQQSLPISVYIRFLNQLQKYSNTSSF